MLWTGPEIDVDRPSAARIYDAHLDGLLAELTGWDLTAVIADVGRQMHFRDPELR